MKKALGVGLGLIAAIVLSSCKDHTEVVLYVEGAATITRHQEIDKEEAAFIYEIPEDQVVVELEALTPRPEDSPDGYTYTVTDLGDLVSLTTTTPFGYDQNGWSPPDGYSEPGLVLLEVDDGGNLAKVTYDLTSNEAPTVSDDDGIDMAFSVTFPGPVVDYWGSGTLEGSTVTWNDAQIRAALADGAPISAMGYVSNDTAPPPANVEQGLPEREPEPHVTETPEAAPAITESPKPDREQRAEREATDDRSDRHSDELATTERDSRFPVTTVVSVGLGVLGLAAITIATIFLIRGKRAGSQIEELSQ